MMDIYASKRHGFKGGNSFPVKLQSLCNHEIWADLVCFGR